MKPTNELLSNNNFDLSITKIKNDIEIRRFVSRMRR